MGADTIRIKLLKPVDTVKIKAGLSNQMLMLKTHRSRPNFVWD